MLEKYEGKTSHTVRAVLIKWIKGIPHLLMVRQNARKQGYIQKDGRTWFERKRIGLPGGRNENGETFMETAVREVKEETGIYLPEDFFSDRLSFEGEVRASDREGFDYCQDIIFFGTLPKDTSVGEIQEKEEVEEALFIELGKIPLPKDAVPFSGKQLKGMLALLRSLETKHEDASELVRILEKHTSYR